VSPAAARFTQASSAPKVVAHDDTLADDLLAMILFDERCSASNPWTVS